MKPCAEPSPRWPGGDQPAPLAPEFLALAEALPDFIVRYDLGGFRTYLNPAVFRAMGPCCADPVGTHVSEPIHGREQNPKLARAITRAVQQVLEVGGPVELPMRWRVPGGPDERVFRFSFVPERDTAGVLTGVLGVGRDLTAHAQAEAGRARSERRFQFAFQHSLLGMALLDGAGRWVRVNPSLCGMLGCTEAELLASSLDRLVLPEDRPAYLRAIRNLLRGRVPSLHQELRCRHRDGRVAWVRWTARRFQGTPIDGGEFVAQFEDISAQRSTMDQLELVSRALAKTRDAVFVMEYPVSPESRILYVNEAACRSLGYRREELLNLTLRDIDPDMDEAGIASLPGLRRRHRSSLTFETRHRTRSGRIFPVEIHGTNFVHQERRLTISVVREISERREAQRRIEASERAFHSLAENALDCISCHDANGRITFANSRLKAFLTDMGILDRKAPPRNLWDTLPDPGFPYFRQELEQALRNGRAASIDLTFHDQDGCRYLHQVHIAPERNAEGKVVGALVIGRDVTAWRANLERMEEAHARLRELTAQLENAREQERRAIARELHDELGQRLVALRLGVHSLGPRLGLAPERVASSLMPLVEQVDHTIGTVRSVCTSLRPAALDFGLVPALKWLGAEFSAYSGLPCQVRVPEAPLELGEEKTATLFRIAQESLTNVAKHAHAATARVTLAALKGKVWLEIRDDGAGFDPASARRPGTYGLLGIQERARAAGAELHIASAPGNGTRVRLCLPVASGTGS